MNPIEAYFRSRPNARRFENQMAFADVCSLLATNRKMTVVEIMDALLCNVCSVVQGATGSEEWEDAGTLLASEIRRRMTVTGDTGDGDYKRRMM